MRHRASDEGQMLILAGAVLILSFLIAAFAITELSQQEAELEQGTEGNIAQVFHETRGEFATAMSALTISSTYNDTLLENFAKQRAEFEERGRAHGLLVVLNVANASAGEAPRTEVQMTEDGTCSTSNEYTVWSHDRSRDFSLYDYDCVNDGILWDIGSNSIKGIAVWFFASNEAARIEQTFVIALN